MSEHFSPVFPSALADCCKVKLCLVQSGILTWERRRTASTKQDSVHIGRVGSHYFECSQAAIQIRCVSYNMTERGLSRDVVLAKTRSTSLDTVRLLNCWGCRISEASLLEHMPNVEVITLSMNRLSSLRYFEHCKNLRELYLRKNQIKDMKELGYLTSLENLSVLWMSGNPIAHLENYRVNVIKNIPTLKKLDNIDITDSEREVAQREGVSIARESLPQKTVIRKLEATHQESQQLQPEQHVTADKQSLDSQRNEQSMNTSSPKSFDTDDKDASSEVAMSAIRTLLPLLTVDQLKDLRLLAKKQFLIVVLNKL
eukprot:gene2615-5517_t